MSLSNLSRLPVHLSPADKANLYNLFGQSAQDQNLNLGALILANLAGLARAPLYVSASFVRPGDTTAYASGDLVANSAVNGAAVVPVPLKVARNAGTGAIIKRVRLSKSTVTTTNATFRVHLFSTKPTVANGDNAALSTTFAGFLGYFDVVVSTTAFTDGAAGFGVPAVGTEIVLNGDADGIVYALVEARAAYGPGNAEVFTITLEGSQS